jgi:hypothetical protein
LPEAHGAAVDEGTGHEHAAQAQTV